MFFRQLARVRLKHITAGFTTSHAINASRRYGRYLLTDAGCRMTPNATMALISATSTSDNQQQPTTQQPTTNPPMKRRFLGVC
jgi:hypothetical protein